MTRLFLLPLAAAAIAAPAFAGEPIRFERDGVTYIASVSERHGIRHIVGHELASGRPFDLAVVRGQVIGTYDGQTVTYPVPAADVTETASR